MESSLFSSEEKAAMRWAEVMTNKLYQSVPGSPAVHREALNDLKRYYSEAQIVELTFVSGFFNFWNRFTDILEIDIEQGTLMESFSKSTQIDKNEFTHYMCECWWQKS